MKLATALLAATAIIALAGCNRTAGNNSAAANTTRDQRRRARAAPAATNSAMPATAMRWAAATAPSRADQPAGDGNEHGRRRRGA